MGGPSIPESRRRNMAAIKGRNTSPELQVRRFVHALGFRFRLHQKALPSRPDIVLKRLATVILVHGCFWHHHGCANSVWPKTRAQFWRGKILENRRRDKMNECELVKLGWRVITVWECGIRDQTAFPSLRRQLLRKTSAKRGARRKNSAGRSQKAGMLRASSKP